MHYNSYHNNPHYLNTTSSHHHHSSLVSPTKPSRHRHSRDLDDALDERIFEYNNYNTNYNFLRSHLSPSPSPVRDSILTRKNHHHSNDYPSHKIIDKKFIDHDLEDRRYVDRYEQLESPSSPDEVLKLKWLDNSPRMSRLRDQRSKRISTRLEQFELWDAEQEQKQKQFELAREQRYRNIMDRLKTQDFCLDQMRRRHESDIETSRELEVYEDEHIYVDPLDQPKPKQKGPISQFRQFQAEMDEKLKTLQDEIDEVNPRCAIEQTILPRLERTRENYSIEPEVYTIKGKRVLKRPQNLRSSESRNYEDDRHLNGIDDDGKCVKFYYPFAINEEDLHSDKVRYELEKDNERVSRKLKPIIQANSNVDVDDSLSKLKISSSTATTANEKRVYFEDDVKNVKIEDDKKVEQAEEAKSEKSTSSSVDDELASEVLVKSGNSDDNSIDEAIRKGSEVIRSIMNEISSNNEQQQQEQPEQQQQQPEA